MKDKNLERGVDAARWTFDAMVDEINSLESTVEDLQNTIESLEEVISELKATILNSDLD